MTSLWLGCLGHATLAYGQSAESGLAVTTWLAKVHQAARQQTYSGTFVVTAGSRMASAKIWHACDARQQMERVESLTGQPRTTFRRNDQVITFFPHTKVALMEKRESLGLFPNLLKSSNSRIADFYRLQSLGSERIAGRDVDVVELRPTDDLRYGYRVWNDKKTGLILQLQTLDAAGKVVEQAAFSELQVGGASGTRELSQMMSNTAGYRLIEREPMQATTPQVQGWGMSRDIGGFTSMGCYRGSIRPYWEQAGADEATMQWMFSDGLATVSIFVEAFDSARHRSEGAADWGGSVHAVARRLDNWWITVVGEVPLVTLNLFSQALERRK